MSLLCLLVALSYAFISTHAIVVEKNSITLELSRFVNATGMHNLVARDRARARALREKAWGFQASQSSNQPVINAAFGYIAKVGIGNPPTQYNLIVDSGSSNTWIGAGIPYSPTQSSNKTRDNVSVSYSMGGFAGNEYIDQVSLSSKLVIPKQSIGVATMSVGFTGVDGILGFGPADLSLGTLTPNSGAIIPTVTDNLYANKAIRHNEVGVYFRPSISPPETTGELSWGGPDYSKMIGDIVYAPLTTAFPANKYWGIDQSIHYGTDTILPTSAGIVDTATTLIMLASDAFEKYTSSIGAVYDTRVGLLSITPAQYTDLKSLYFVIGGVTFELVPNAQIWPRSLNTLIRGSSSAIYLIVADLGYSSGHGFDFINGFTFLQRYYSVYDTANQRLGLAVTHHTMEETN